MEKELLGAMIPMMVFKKEIYDFVESLIKEKFQSEKKKELLTVKEAANFLNVKVSWVRQAVFKREINHVKVGALVRFREEDLQSYIHKNLKPVGTS
ncbi:MAG: helix-turn-helix domain-containing protein [Bdellovibrio sp.]|nr:helix-turn-helix domain-containing protein [Bdellovibrio sp.]